MRVVKWCVLTIVLFFGPFLVTSTVNASPGYLCYEPVDGLPLLPVDGVEECKTPDPAPRAPSRPFWKRCVTGLACAKAVLPHYFKDWRYALAIVRCETGGTYSNRTLGSASERGIFQIHPVHFGWVNEARLWDVRYNSRIAKRLSRNGTNWRPWTCSRYV